MTRWQEIKFEIYWFCKHLIPYSWRDWYYKYVRCVFRPQHSRLRKAIPRTWMDISCLIETVNFEFIKSFYEQEYKADIVDWNYDEPHRDFANWLESAYAYITKERPELEKQMWAAYPEYGENWWSDYKSGDKSYKEAYAEVHRLEDLIRKKDTNVLTELINRRECFWT